MGVVAPGINEGTGEIDGELAPEASARCRAFAAWANDLAQARVDTQLVANELCRHMGKANGIRYAGVADAGKVSCGAPEVYPEACQAKDDRGIDGDR